MRFKFFSGIINNHSIPFPVGAKDCGGMIHIGAEEKLISLLSEHKVENTLLNPVINHMTQDIDRRILNEIINCVGNGLPQYSSIDNKCFLKYKLKHEVQIFKNRTRKYR